MDSTGSRSKVKRLVSPKSYPWNISPSPFPSSTFSLVHSSTSRRSAMKSETLKSLLATGRERHAYPTIALINSMDIWVITHPLMQSSPMRSLGFQKQAHIRTSRYINNVLSLKWGKSLFLRTMSLFSTRIITTPSPNKRSCVSVETKTKTKGKLSHCNYCKTNAIF